MVGLLALLLLVAWNGCTKKQPEQKAETEAEESPYAGSVDEDGKAKGSALAVVHTADALYQCPMHPEIVTDHAAARCPECGMNLEKMSDESLAELRASNPKGCLMCAYVVPGDAEATQCPYGTELVKAPAEQEKVDFDEREEDKAVLTESEEEEGGH
jgi:hypothetical protein